MKKKRLTRWLIGAFALSMAVMQPVSVLPDTSPLNTVVTAEAATTKPGKPKLKSIKATAYNKIQINWNKTSNATHYRIYYKKPGDKWKLITTVKSNVTSYTHKSSSKYPIRVGQKYTYTVRAYNSKTKKLGSYDSKGLTTKTIPSTVKLKSIKLNSSNTVTVSWNKAYGANTYRVYRKTTSSPKWKLIASVKSGVYSYTDKSPVKGQKNTYTVRYYNSNTKVAGKYDTKGLSVTVPKASTVTPGQPKLTSIKATHYNKIQITWNKASNATNYRIYYKVPGGSWKLITTVGSDVTSYTHKSSTKYPIKVGQDYIYTVRGYNSSSKKAGSYDATGLTAHTVPSIVYMTDIKANAENSAVTISWKKAYGGDYYYVYRKTESNPTWTNIGFISTPFLSFTDEHPVAGETNTYTVRMYKSDTRVAGKYDVDGLSIDIPSSQPEGPDEPEEPTPTPEPEEPEVTPTPVPEEPDEPEVTPTPDPEPEEPTLNIDQMIQEVVRLTNEERAKNGRAPLQYNQRLTDIAMVRAQEISVSFSHTRPDGTTTGIGENIAATGHSSPEKVMTLWMNSSGHRASIMNAAYAYIGVGIYQLDDGRTFWVQAFTDYDPDRTVTITLNPNGGTCDTASITVPYKSKVYQEDLPIATREGYTFKGWTFRSGIFTSLNVPKDITLTAVWEPNA